MPNPDFLALSRLRAERPLIHCICNIVSARDCANLLLAAGASPIMAQAPQETAEIAAAAGALVVSTGTPSEEKFSASLSAMRAAQKAERPIVLDPVGVGASEWRRQNIGALLSAARPALLHVNLGEAQTLLQGVSRERGVDSPVCSAADGAFDIAPSLSAATALARQQHTVVLLSGAEDLVTDGSRSLRILGGSPLCRRITGAGCMLSALCGAFLAVEPDAFQAAALAAAYWKACAALAGQKAAGLGGFCSALFDAAGTLSPEQLVAAVQFLPL